MNLWLKNIIINAGGKTVFAKLFTSVLSAGKTKRSAIVEWLKNYTRVNAEEYAAVTLFMKNSY